MNTINQNIEKISQIIKKHGIYSNFSGIAPLIAGILWLANEGIHFFIYPYEPRLRILSWVIVALVSIIIATYLTVFEGQKKGKAVITLSLLTLIDKLLIIAVTSLVLIWIFYINRLILQIPALLLTMYGILILTSKNNLVPPIIYFGYLSFVIGLLALIFPLYSVLATTLVLGVGHIILGITLLIKREK